MARAIIRYSFDGPDGPRTRNRAAAVLRAHGFGPYGTGTWECREGNAGVLLDALEELTQVLRAADAAPVDNLWFYLD
jgi:hypothetical protein